MVSKAFPSKTESPGQLLFFQFPSTFVRKLLENPGHLLLFHPPCGRDLFPIRRAESLCPSPLPEIGKVNVLLILQFVYSGLNDSNHLLKSGPAELILPKALQRISLEKVHLWLNIRVVSLVYWAQFIPQKKLRLLNTTCYQLKRLTKFKFVLIC